MASVKSILDCIGVNTSGGVTILGNMFGFWRLRVPNDPCSTARAQVSLLEQVKSLQGKHIHLNIIRVGIDNFTDTELERIDYAIYKARRIYNTRNLGIGRVEHYDVTSSAARGRDDIGSESEAEDLTQDWTVPNNGIDVFMVDNISDPDFVGISPINGPCDKDSKGMEGVLAGEVNRSAEGVARTFAHEIGHYLGLKHNHGDDNCPTTASGRDNLMAQTRCANSVCDSVQLSSSQGSKIRSNCFVKSGC
jgi:hypothetical protein